MQTRPTLKATLTTGGILLSGVFLFAQAASTVTPAKPTTTKPDEKQAATTQPYKDPEDMTTRYRPGNNKTTKIEPPAQAPQTATDASAAKKHLAGVKYSNKTVADATTATQPGAAPKQ